MGAASAPRICLSEMATSLLCRYLGKIAFLERADVRQFERERDLRAKRRNPLLKRAED